MARGGLYRLRRQAEQQSATPPYEALTRVNVKANRYGYTLAGDAVTLTDCYITTGTNRVYSASNGFLGATVGMGVDMSGAGSSGGRLSSSPSNQLRAITAVAVDGSYVDFDDAAHGLAATTVVAPRVTTDGNMVAGTGTLTSSDAAFTSSDIGKTVTIPGAVSSEYLPQVVTRSGAMTSGSAVLTSSTACFDAATYTTGKYIRVSGAGTPSGGFAPPLLAKIATWNSTTSITLDTLAGANVTQAEVRYFGTPTAATMVICKINSATSAVVSQFADFPVTAQALTISGSTVVFGTNDTDNLNSLLAAVPAGTELLFPKGGYFLPIRSLTWTQPIIFTGQGHDSCYFHLGGSTRFTVANGSDGSRFNRIGFRGFCYGAGGNAGCANMFNTGTGVAVKDWIFDDCKWTSVQMLMPVTGAKGNNGTPLAAGCGLARDITIRDSEATKVMGTYVFQPDGINGITFDNVNIHHNWGPTATNQYGIKCSSSCQRARLINVVAMYNSYGGVDFYDSQGSEIIGGHFSRNGGLGLDTKWNSTQNYSATQRSILMGFQCDLNGQQGASIADPSMLGSNIRCNGNLLDGLLINHGSNGTGDVTLYASFTNIECVGNQQNGININQSVQYSTFIGVQAHGNGGTGISNGGTDIKLIGCHAFGNYVTGGGNIYHASTCTRVQQVACQSGDANGQFVAHASAVDVIAHGVDFAFGATTGSKLGLATTDKWAAHGSTPVIQRASVAQAAVVTTAATQTTPYGFATQAQADALVTLANELRAALVEKGIIKGSA